MIIEAFWYQLVCVFLLGIILGSFYNVVIIRSLNGESIVAPSSHCQNCKTTLIWWQNIPLISYFILRGKCFYCKEPIDIQYPIIEFLSGCLFVVSFIKYGLLLKTILCFICLSIFLILAGMDIKGKVISEKLAISLIIFSILFNFNMDSIIGTLLLFFAFYGVKKILDKYFRKEFFGEGDIYMLSALGGFVGVSHIIPIIFLTLLFQFFFCIPEYIKELINLKKYDVIWLGLWFFVAYSILFLSRFYIISLNPLLTFLTFVNVIVSFILISKNLITDIRNSSITLIEPLSPSVLLTAFLYLFLF